MLGAFVLEVGFHSVRTLRWLFSLDVESYFGSFHLQALSMSPIPLPLLSIDYSARVNTLHNARDQMLDPLNCVVEAWASGNWSEIECFLSDHCFMYSSAHGQVGGAKLIASKLRLDPLNAERLVLRSTNHYAGGVGRIGAASAYVFGEWLVNGMKLIFGATVVAQLFFDERHWLIKELRVAVNWLDGDRSVAKHWSLPSDSLGWRTGDATPTIVSELDSPWATHPAPSLVGNLQQQVVETFSRYAWAIDQADAALLIKCFTADATGDFPPLGHLDGIHDVIGQLKAFRQRWPWMQHFGQPISIEIGADEASARMVVGRIFPHQATTSAGQELFGAHYELLLQKEAALWKIHAFDYRAGWFTHLPPGDQAHPSP